MSNYIGIDLGTTYSVVATLDEGGRPCIIDNKDTVMSPQGNITSSCVLIESKKMSVGEPARKARAHSESAVRNCAVGRFKREMGTSATYKREGDSYTPTDLSAAVLIQMKKIAEEEVNELSKVVVTVPANFANEAREATLQAAKKAGLDVDFIINEPTAAALHYAYKLGENLNGIYAVYDLGGGTFDISIMSISGDKIDVLASNGIAKLGGEDFDLELTKVVGEKFKSEAGRDMDVNDYTPFQAEEDKISLSNKKRIVAGGIDQNVGGLTVLVTRSEFEEAISGMLAQTALVCDATLEQAGINKQDVTGIILAGGSTRIPAVRQLVERTFGKTPVTSENPDEAVALGAALYAAMKSDGEHLSTTQKQAVEKMSVQEITNKYYGILVQSWRNGKRVVDRNGKQKNDNATIIKKGSKIPCSFTGNFVTSYDGQTGISCEVTESENEETDPQWVTVVWKGVLEVPPNRPAGQEMQAIYSYDDNQCMHCVFKDVQSGKILEVDIDAGSATTDATSIDKFLVD